MESNGNRELFADHNQCHIVLSGQDFYLSYLFFLMDSQTSTVNIWKVQQSISFMKGPLERFLNSLTLNVAPLESRVKKVRGKYGQVGLGYQQNTEAIHILQNP